MVWTYAGVRPLYDDGASEAKAATREYVFELDTPGGAPLLSIYGGKITTYRRLAEEALEHLSPYLRAPRGLQGARGLDREIAAARRRSRCFRDRRAVGGTSAQLFVSDTGTCQPAGARLRHPRRKLLGNAKSMADLGQSFGATLTESRSQVPDVVGMGLHRRRHRMAAIQAWIAAVAAEIAAIDDWIAPIGPA